MPTENRSSNTEMVSVPRHTLENVLNDGSCKAEVHAAFIRARHDIERLLTQPAEQHQGDPVALPSCKARLSESHDWDHGYRGGWRACLDEIAKLGPLYSRPVQGEPVAWIFRQLPEAQLEVTERWDVAKHLPYDTTPVYTHADPGEVERLRKEIERMRERVTPTHKSLIGKHAEIIKQRDTLRAQLAERDALLREALKALPYGNAYLGIERALSASAEPRKPQLVECDACPRSSGCVGTCMKSPPSAEPEVKS